MTKKLIRPMESYNELSTKFKINLIRSLAANVQKLLDQKNKQTGKWQVSGTW